MSLKRVLLFSLCILVLSGLVGCRETEITVKSELCAQIRASSLAGGACLVRSNQPPVASLGSSTVCVIPAFMKKKSKALDLELTSSSILIETGGKKMKKLLIIYYSWSNGNTERIAKMLQSETDSDILKIDTVVPYSGSYDDVVNQGQNEVQRGYEPEIKPLDINIADYDVIAVGTPTWWYTMAPAVKTFLHQQDFTGKTVVPFMTNGGWPGHVIKDMKAACKGANVVCDMQIQFDSTGGSNLETPQEQINEWIQSVKNLL